MVLSKGMADRSLKNRSLIGMWAGLRENNETDAVL